MRKRTFAAILCISPFIAGCNVSMPFGMPKFGGQASTVPNNSFAANPSASKWSWKTPVEAVSKLNPFRSADSGTAGDASPLAIQPEDPLSLRNSPAKVGPEIYLRAAELYEASGNLDRATAQYQLAMKAAPNDPAVLCGYARSLSKQGKVDEAVQMYSQAAEKQPENASIHNDLGLCLARHKQYDAALQALDYAIQLRPQETLYRNNVARVLVECGRPDEAFQHLAAVHPPAVAHYNVGYMLYERQQKDLAHQHFAQAIQLDPTFVKAERMLQLLSGRVEAELAAGAQFLPQLQPPQQGAPQLAPQLASPQGPSPTPAPVPQQATPTLLPPAQRY